MLEFRPIDKGRNLHYDVKGRDLHHNTLFGRNFPPPGVHSGCGMFTSTLLANRWPQRSKPGTSVPTRHFGHEWVGASKNLVGAAATTYSTGQRILIYCRISDWKITNPFHAPSLVCVLNKMNTLGPVGLCLRGFQRFKGSRLTNGGRREVEERYMEKIIVMDILQSLGRLLIWIASFLKKIVQYYRCDIYFTIPREPEEK